ncbi:hypothetical protein [Enterococcus bulliens]
MIVAYFVFHMPLILLIAFMIGGLIGSTIFSQVYFWRDFRLFSSHWTDLTQLFSRGAGTFGLVLLQFSGLIIGGILVSAVAFVSYLVPNSLVPIGLVLVVLLGVGVVHMYYYKKYWSTL